MNELEQYMQGIDALVKKMEPAQINRALREISKELRKRNQERIKANTDPTGRKFQDRKPDKSQLRKLGIRALRPRQAFAYMKKRNIKLAFVRDMDDRYVGRIDGTNDMVGLKKDFIRLKTTSTKNNRLFKKLHQTRWLKSKVANGEATVGFMNGFVSKIASEQHYGLSSKRLPSRMLLGLPSEDLDYVEEVLLKYLDSNN